MNCKAKLLGLLLSSLMTASALPASADVEFESTYTLKQYNTRGSAFKVLLGTNTWSHFCFLTSMTVEETDTGSEHARCKVYMDYPSWWMQANLGKSSDADVECTATCYTLY